LKKIELCAESERKYNCVGLVMYKNGRKLKFVRVYEQGVDGNRIYLDCERIENGSK
jgi:hypothetical protein